MRRYQDFVKKRTTVFNIQIYVFYQQIGHDWGYFTMVTDLPKYMTDVLKFNIKSTGYLSSLPYISMWVASFFFGMVCDFCIKRGYHSISSARKIYTTIGRLRRELTSKIIAEKN